MAACEAVCEWPHVSGRCMRWVSDDEAARYLPIVGPGGGGTVAPGRLLLHTYSWGWGTPPVHWHVLARVAMPATRKATSTHTANVSKSTRQTAYQEGPNQGTKTVHNTCGRGCASH